MAIGPEESADVLNLLASQTQGDHIEMDAVVCQRYRAAAFVDAPRAEHAESSHAISKGRVFVELRVVYADHSVAINWDDDGVAFPVAI